MIIAQYLIHIYIYICYLCLYAWRRVEVCLEGCEWVISTLKAMGSVKLLHQTLANSTKSLRSLNDPEHKEKDKGGEEEEDETAVAGDATRQLKELIKTRGVCENYVYVQLTSLVAILDELILGKIVYI